MSEARESEKAATFQNRGKSKSRPSRDLLGCSTLLHRIRVLVPKTRVFCLLASPTQMKSHETSPRDRARSESVSQALPFEKTSWGLVSSFPCISRYVPARARRYGGVGPVQTTGCSPIGGRRCERFEGTLRRVQRKDRLNRTCQIESNNRNMQWKEVIRF
ncbi:hypothetical protein AA313_de0209385 [Arthrobotrys entomopaga]|nr:hypothetical protein AA313_de0209385 [Arthrobotrys entomopaga]